MDKIKNVMISYSIDINYNGGDKTHEFELLEFDDSELSQEELNNLTDIQSSYFMNFIAYSMIEKIKCDNLDYRIINISFTVAIERNNQPYQQFKTSCNKTGIPTVYLEDRTQFYDGYMYEEFSAYSTSEILELLND